MSAEQDRADLAMAQVLASINEGLWKVRGAIETRTEVEPELDGLQATLADLSARCSLAVSGRYHEAVAQQMRVTGEGEG